MFDKGKFGEKHLCPACGCKFYDMHRSPIVCPRCGTDASSIQKFAAEEGLSFDYDEEEVDEEVGTTEMEEEEDFELPQEDEDLDDL